MNEDRGEDQESEKKYADSASNDRISSGEIDGLVVCRLLAPSNQVGRVLGRGGKVVEKIRQESMAHVKVFPKDQIPACASPGDELIQVIRLSFFALEIRSSSSSSYKFLSC